MLQLTGAVESSVAAAVGSKWLGSWDVDGVGVGTAAAALVAGDGSWLG